MRILKGDMAYMYIVVLRPLRTEISKIDKSSRWSFENILKCDLKAATSICKRIHEKQVTFAKRNNPLVCVYVILYIVHVKKYNTCT